MNTEVETKEALKQKQKMQSFGKSYMPHHIKWNLGNNDNESSSDPASSSGAQ